MSNLNDIKESDFPMPVWKLFVLCGLCKSGNEAKRLLKQGGMYVNGDRITSETMMVGIEYVKPE